LPNFPAEIRAPGGTLPGVSSFQVHFADYDILTPGDAPNVLVAMNPAALKANVSDLPGPAHLDDGGGAGGLGFVQEGRRAAKNMFALGFLSWMYSRPFESTIAFLRKKFAKRPELVAANIAAFRAGWNIGETTEDFAAAPMSKIRAAPWPASARSPRRACR
jgi:2-oxoglutarate ferredoxin oxidoreductase subunit alpha